MRRSILALFAAAVLAGCATTVPSASPAFYEPADAEAPTFSLLGGARLDEAAIARLLSAQVEIPAGAKVAVLQAPGRTASRSSYGRMSLTEDDVRAREAFLDTLRARLLPAGAREVVVLPSLLVPAETDLTAFREVAVRLQADALLILRLDGDLFQNYRFFRSNRFKAYATCEAVWLDVRTGAIPFTAVVTREVLTQKQDGDLDDGDAGRRARLTAEALALDAVGQEAARFLLSR